MGSVSQVVEYLSRYAHKVAISNHRILEIGDQTVKFQYKDYSDHNKVKQMVLSSVEFITKLKGAPIRKTKNKLTFYPNRASPLQQVSLNRE